MMNASAISKMIREKKKKMEAPDRDAVKLSGIPEDATDHAVIKNKEEGEMLSENEPKMHSEGEELTPAAEMNEEHKDGEIHDSHTMSVELENLKKHKMAKIGKMMSKMGS